MSTWCDKVSQIINSELQQICHLARLAMLAPNEAARVMVLRLIDEEIGEAKFWSNVHCCSCDTCMPGSPGTGWQPGIPAPCPAGPACPSTGPVIGVGPSIGSSPGINIGSTTLRSGMLPGRYGPVPAWHGPGIRMGPAGPGWYKMGPGAPITRTKRRVTRQGDATSAGPGSPLRLKDKA